MISFLAEWQDQKLPARGIYIQNHFNAINVMKFMKTKLQKMDYLINNDISIESKECLCYTL